MYWNYTLVIQALMFWRFFIKYTHKLEKTREQMEDFDIDDIDVEQHSE